MRRFMDDVLVYFPFNLVGVVVHGCLNQAVGKHVVVHCISRIETKAVVRVAAAEIQPTLLLVIVET